MQEDSHLSTRWGADARPALLGDREQRRRPLDPPDGPQDRLWTRQPGKPLKKINLGYWTASLPSLNNHRPIQEESCDLKFGSWVYNAGQLDLRPVDWKSLDTFMFFFCPLLLICPHTEHWHDGPGGLHWQHPVGPLGNPCVQVSRKTLMLLWYACL